jgi:hypothetical protein
MLAASFGPDGRDKRFLKRVSAQLLATAVTDKDRSRIVEPRRFFAPARPADEGKRDAMVPAASRRREIGR